MEKKVASEKENKGSNSSGSSGSDGKEGRDYGTGDTVKKGK